MKRFIDSIRARGRQGLAVLLLVSVAGSAGCKGSATPIKTLLDDPGRYDGQAVRVAGEVTSAVGLLGYGVYKLKDDTGEILVVSKAGAPREGAKVGVEGTFKSVYTFHDQTGAAIEETNRYEP